MSALTLLGKAIYWTLGALQGAGEVIGAGKKLVRAARRGKLPHSVPDSSNATDPIPLTRRSAVKAPGPLKMR